MPTDDERREVAARLREFEQLRAAFKDSSICAFSDALGVGYMDWEHICARLADLIEQEERTCRMTVLENARGNPKHFLMYVCSECHGAVVHDKYDPIYYCPNCGAKVVEE